MSGPVVVDFEVDPAWEADARLELEVDGVVQPDRVNPWLGFAREKMGFGRGSPHYTAFGVAVFPVDQVGFGAGGFGSGAPVVRHTSLENFDNGPKKVRVRAVDPAGNAGDWSPERVVWVLDPPPPPRALATGAGGLSWSWP